MKKNDLIKVENILYRILHMDSENVLAIDCEKRSMPKFFPLGFFDSGEIIGDSPLTIQTIDSYSSAQISIARKRYTMIANILPVISDIAKRNYMINYSAEYYGVSKQTIRSYLISYLIHQDIVILSPKKRAEKELTDYEKNFRWALNKFYYNPNRIPLTTAYILLLKEKYSDNNGTLLSEYPSFNQFRYYYRKHKKLESYYISRNGLTDYLRNDRPLFATVQEFAPNTGTAMIDSTICDIYLVNEAGQLVGRPILVAAIDCNSYLCMGYALIWEGGTYSLQKLMVNIISDKYTWWIRLVYYCWSIGIRKKFCC